MFDTNTFNLTFKNVGQGDCIFLEWTENEVPKIAIIDCHKHSNFSSSILSHLERYSEIEFIMLSHPHSDHYSGLHDLLIFCNYRNILVRQIYHTMHYHPVMMNFMLTKDNPDPFDRYLRSFSNSSFDFKELRKLFILISKLKKSGKTLVNSVSCGRILYQSRDKGLNIKCLSPDDEGERYFRTTFTSESGSVRNLRIRENSDANLLSSVVSIELWGGVILLTSDATQHTFERLKRDCDSYFDKSKPIYGFQIPHHGSNDNHYPLFWENYEIEKSYAFLSVGKNKYGHPASDVVTFFKQRVHQVHSTYHFQPNMELTEGISNNITFDMESPEGLSDVINFSQNYDKNFVFPFSNDKLFSISKEGGVSIRPWHYL